MEAVRDEDGRVAEAEREPGRPRAGRDPWDMLGYRWGRIRREDGIGKGGRRETEDYGG